MRAAGYFNIAEFSRACGVAQGTIGLYLNLKQPAMKLGTCGKAKAGAVAEFRSSVIQMAEHLKLSPFDLFPFKFLEGHLETNTVEREYKEEEVQCLMDNTQENMDHHLLLQDRDAILSSVLITLTPREERVLRLRFGLNGEDEKTLEEIGKEFGTSRTRVNQIEQKALRKLRRPQRSAALREFMEL